MATKHGGRRHGLAPTGKAQRFQLSLAPEESDALARLSAKWGCSMAEAIRRLIREAAGG